MPVISRIGSLVGLTVYATLAIAQNSVDSSGAPPSGYAWYTAKNGVGTYLTPESWHTSEEASPDTGGLFKGAQTLYITPEDRAEKPTFKTGLTINRISNVQTKTHTAASVFARNFVTLAAQRYGVRQIMQAKLADGHLAYIAEATVRSPEGTKEVRYVTVGDDEKDEAFVLIVEAPSADYPSTRAVLGPVLNNLKLAF